MEFKKIKVTSKDIENARKLESIMVEIGTLQKYFNRRKLEVVGVPSKELRGLTDEQIEYYNSVRDRFYELDNMLWGCYRLNDPINGTISIMEELFRDNDLMED